MMGLSSIRRGLPVGVCLIAALLWNGAVAGEPVKGGAAKGAADRVGHEIPTTPASEPMATYVIKKGDTLWGLADKYFVRVPAYEEVRVRNRVKYVRRMAVGLTLLIPVRLLKTDPIDARLGAFSGDVTITGVAGALAVGSVVREGAVVTTGANAFARLDLPDGSRMAVPSQSRVRLDSLHRVRLTGAVERTFAVIDGRTQSSVAPLSGPQDNYYVRTPVSVSAVRGTEFRVSYDAAGNTASTGVIEGSVAVDALQTGSALVPAKFGVGVRPGGPLRVTPLLPAPGVADPGRVQNGKQVAFQIGDGIEGAASYRMQLGADAGVSEVFSEQAHVRAQPDFDFGEIADGDYFLRVTAIDSAGVEGLPHIYAWRRDLNTLIPGAAEIQGERGDRRFLFKWLSEGEGVRVYRFQIWREPTGDAPLIDEGGLNDLQLTVTNLPPGEYRWRVMSTTAHMGRTTELWSPVQNFTVPVK